MISSAAHFATELLETDETVETDITNDIFLQTVFSDDLGEARPVLVSFRGDPGRVSNGSWAGFSWDSSIQTTTILSPESNNYFSLAVFRPDSSGRTRRLKSLFQALYAIMLDDIGSKVAMERLTLAPTWLLETSPGNYQAGFILREPLADGKFAYTLMNAVVAAGLCDPGATGPQSRLARLPVAVNGKFSPAFPCRLIQWFPERSYSVEELVDGLQLELAVLPRYHQSTVKDTCDLPAGFDQVLIPCPEENPILTALRGLGLYKAPLGEGKHEIVCPWVNEHTDQLSGGTAFFEPDEIWPVGGFKCLHGHCADRHISDLLRFFNIPVSAARMKPTIRIMAGELNRVVDTAERELAASQRFYQRGGLIVTVVTDPGTRETRIQNISQPALVRGLARSATWERYDGRRREWVRCDPPARHASVLFDSPGYPHLPVLNGLARQPYLRDDGSLMSTPGYDPVTGMFGIFDAHEFSTPDNPTREEAEAALAELTNLLSEFSFLRPVDRTATLVAILTASIRGSLAHSPMFHVRAHVVGSGKSYLCELITAFATPQRGTPLTFPGDDEECRKLLLAELMRSPAVIEFDNLTSDLVAHRSLCTALTSEFMSGRILGVSKTASVSTRTLFLSSGNNVGPVRDMARRCLTIQLDPGCEVPASRRFQRPELVHEVLRDRSRYVSLALTIVRAWIVAGRPMAECAALAGFGDWSDQCRQPLLWLGSPDPVASIFEAIADDPDREILGRLLIAWQEAFGKRAAMVREAVKLVALQPQQHDELGEVLRDIAEEQGELNHRRLGRWIKRNSGRLVDGRRFSRGSGKRSAEAWQVEGTKSVSEVLPVSVLEVGKSGSAHEAVKKRSTTKNAGQLSLLGVIA